MGEREVIGRTSVPLTRESLAADLKELGLGEGERVIVHASLSSLGYVVGGAEAVIQALMDVLTSTGTLVMPTQSPHCRSLLSGKTRRCLKSGGRCSGSICQPMILTSLLLSGWVRSRIPFVLSQEFFVAIIRSSPLPPGGMMRGKWWRVTVWPSVWEKIPPWPSCMIVMPMFFCWEWAMRAIHPFIWQNIGCREEK